MPTGKLTPADLSRLVFQRLKQRRPEVRLRAALGEDSAALDLGPDLCVISTDPITGAVSNAGWLAVHVSCNDVASNGAEPVAVLLTILLPPDSSQQAVAEILQDAENAASEVGVEIVGGHTEFTPAVNQPVLSTTVVGRVPAGKLAESRLARSGDAIIVSNYVGLEGTAILAWDHEELVAPVLGHEMLQEARGLSREISIVQTARIASNLGARAMHDVTEGGILGAAFEMAEAAGVGFILDEEFMPVHPATRRLVTALNLDFLRLISSGALLVASPDPAPIVQALRLAGKPAAVIGSFTSDSRKRIKLPSSRLVEVEPPESDELWHFLARLRAGTIQNPAGYNKANSPEH